MLEKFIKRYVESSLKKEKFLMSFDRSQHYVKRPNKDQLRGIYLFYPHKEKNRPLYVGESNTNIFSRLANHRKSLRQPDWKVERTGSKFLAMNLDLDQTIDVYYIDIADLNLIEESKHQLRLVELMFIEYLKPYAFYDK